MASQSSSGLYKRQKSLRWQRLERLNTPSPIIPLADDLDELTIEPPAVIEPPIAPVNLPELDAEIEVDAPNAFFGVPESGESSELPTIADASETLAESAAPEAAVEPEAIDPVAPIALDIDDSDWDSEVIEFVPSTADLAATETPSATATSSPTGEVPVTLPDEIATESAVVTIAADPAEVNPEAVGDGEIDVTTDSEPDLELPLQPITLPDPEPLFQSGTFTVGASGQVVIDVLWDGGAYRGQAGIFSLSGLDAYELGSTDFIAEVARRVTSNSVLGHVIWDDPTEAARFSGVMNGEANFNDGTYAGLKRFEMQAGDKFGVVLAPDTTFVKVLEQPWAEGSWRLLFSMVTANPNDSFQMGQIADVTGDGNTFTFEDLRVDHGGDKDYNDFIFQVRGATGEAVLMDEVVAPGKDWRSTNAGQLLVSYAKQYVEAPIEGAISPDLDGFAGDDGLLPAPPVDLSLDFEDLPLDFEPSADEALPNPADEVLPDGAANLPGSLPTYTETRFEFPAENQPVIGIIDTGFAGNNVDFNFNNITWGKDYVDGDMDPTLADGEGSQHGTHILGVIAAQRDNGVGIDGINPDAPIYATRAIGSGAWAEALVDTVDHIRASGQPNGIVNLSFDLTQKNPDGSITTRYEFTPQEQAAIEYARQNGVVLVVAAGNDGGMMSALGQASQKFDNIVTVGAVERTNGGISLYMGTDRVDYASYGDGLTVVADGGTVDNPVLSTVGDGVGTMAGTSVATARVTGVVSQIWAANPNLSYRQVIDILKNTATDLGTPGWDAQTGAGLVNLVAAVQLAKMTRPEAHSTPSILSPETWSGEGQVTAGERAVQNVTVPPVWRRFYHGWLNEANPTDRFTFTLTRPGPLQFSLNFPGTAVLTDRNGRTVLTGQRQPDGMLYAGGNLNPGTYTLTVGRGSRTTVENYRLVMNFIPGSVGQETPIVTHLPRPRYYPDLVRWTRDQWDEYSGDNTRFDGAIWPGEVDERHKNPASIKNIYTDLSTEILGRRYRMTAGYLYDKSYRKGTGKWHAGIDIGAPAGTAVKTVTGGTVAWTWSSPTAGAFIAINGTDGKQWVYGHLQSLGGFTAGQRINPGQLIGSIGNQSGAHHLHLEVRTANISTGGAHPDQALVKRATMSPLQAYWQLKQ